MVSGSENPQIALSQALAQRRIQTVSVQRPQQNIQQMTIDPSMSPATSQPQTSPVPNQQTATQPQHSPQQVKQNNL